MLSVKSILGQMGMGQRTGDGTAGSTAVCHYMIPLYPARTPHPPVVLPTAALTCRAPFYIVAYRPSKPDSHGVVEVEGG